MRLFETVRHLRPVQVYGRIAFGLRRPQARRVGLVGRRATVGPWKRSIVRATAQTGPNRFRFLNDEREVAGWEATSAPKLWRYNLHYFDAPEAGLIGRWVQEHARGEGWEPYPLSRRIVNWIKWALNGHELPAGAEVSLAQQTEFLTRRVEHHLQANHLFANAKALVFGGAFLMGRQAHRWLDMGLELLEREIAEQILSDGAHYERSPLYHALVLEDVLDLVNLGKAYPGLLPDWSETAGRMLGWLRTMTHPDGEIALFNDAAFGVAARPAELETYAARLGVEAVQAGESSGYYRLERGGTVVLFDAAPIGPDHQPGHAHADTLGFELSHGGRRVLVDSGTSVYEKGAERDRQRGTAAHNTIRVDGQDQSEVWGGFRVARRARPVEANGEESDAVATASAGHDGYRRLADPVTHRRRMEVRDGEVRIEDRLEGQGRHSAEIYFHCHPEIELERVEAGAYRLRAGGQRVGVVRMNPEWEVRVEESTYHPEFGLSIANRRIVGRWAGGCPACFETRIVFEI